MQTTNCYADAQRAEAYAKLAFPGTYYLAFRDLPAILGRHVAGRRALDFGCGTGRSTRFLREQGFDALGVDIAAEMLAKAREIDPGGDYRETSGEQLERLGLEAYDLVFSAFTFDNIPASAKVPLFRSLARLLRRGGRFVNLVSSPAIYLHEWVSFSTRDFPQNAQAQSGDTVRIRVTELDDSRPVEDVLCTSRSYRRCFARSGLRALRSYAPLGRAAEPIAWVSETRIAPWIIHVLGRAE